jgi:NADH-quinone oxidoreductase subunit N
MNVSLFLPETVLCGMITVYLCLTLAKNAPSARMLANLAGLGASVVVAAAVFSLNATGELFGGTYRIDLLAQAFKALIALGFLFTVLVSGEAVALPGLRLVLTGPFGPVFDAVIPPGGFDSSARFPP